MTDVVVVGGGIAGSALAVQLCRGGVPVTVLERTEQFPDRVRGETIPPWGYLEVAGSGLVDVVMQAEGTVATRYVSYGDAMSVEQAEAAAVDATAVVPGSPGSLNLSHPDACQALLDAAEEAGAEVVRGVSDVHVTPGTAPRVSYRIGGELHELSPRLVVGADGRSSVVRKQIGIALERSGVRSFASGVLLDEVGGWPITTNTTGTWDDVYFLLFPREGNRLRLYLLWDKADPQRFAGPEGPARMIERVSTLPCLPDPSIFTTAVPVPGSAASYPMEDTWCDRPFTDGVVLIGDAAGWNDPVIGQGLSISFRDARLVAETLLRSSTWDTQAFEPYGVERAERLRRLRATAETTTRLRAEFGPEARRRREIVFARFAQDPTTRLPIAAALLGPHSLPPEAFTREAADRMLAV
jgi:2-polyprenyl-6-methoxyphenol hydroxylase-like FAD-dependent oxidoreductase